ncbi:hypothetical protein [Nafulsella turpanensis]|uniref:hypothetical protein n=1 Tax=Nafulsella turpanensis TaxID=1265690 RepID=UPI000379C535|nr:hypothetical protein [Nafulsella turpanensis]
MDNNKIIDQVRKALVSYDKNWDEWLNSDACFLNSIEIKAIGYVLAFQDVEESAYLLNISRDEYLLVLNHTIKKLEEQQFKYIAWLASKMVVSN